MNGNFKGLIYGRVSAEKWQRKRADFSILSSLKLKCWNALKFDGWKERCILLFPLKPVVAFTFWSVCVILFLPQVLFNFTPITNTVGQSLSPFFCFWLYSLTYINEEIHPLCRCCTYIQQKVGLLDNNSLHLVCDNLHNKAVYELNTYLCMKWTLLCDCWDPLKTMNKKWNLFRQSN